jgi:hypothetical protein
MVTDTSVEVEMVEAIEEACLCEDPLQGYQGEPLVSCPVCCRMCSEAAVDAAQDAAAWWAHEEELWGPQLEMDEDW